jgi:tetratricopeptide (TPR) repeat protein
MNSKSLAVLCVAAFLGTAGLILADAMGWRKSSAPAVDPALLGRIQDRLSDVERELAATKLAVESDREAVRRALDFARRSQSPAPEGVVTSARTDGGASAPDAAPGAAGATSKPADALTADSAIATLIDRKISWDDKEKLWKRIREAGLTDEVIKLLEKRAAANPKDPDAQTDLGNAYLKKIQEVPQGPESGTWATKADEAYDKALELNPEHWESRFMKATALSFWPAVFGKQGEAVKHYETLVAQQERQTAREGFAETYYFLGNMYQQMGQIDQAVSTWNRGLKLFPDNQNLRQQIANAGSLRR